MVASDVAALMAFLLCCTTLYYYHCNKSLVFVSDEQAQSHLGYRMDVLGLQLQQCPMPVPYVT